jgi:hypothetical protein
MKRTRVLVLGAVSLIAVVAFVVGFRDAVAADDTSRIEADLQLALKRLRGASVHERNADRALTMDVMIMADALGSGGDARRKQVAADVKKEVGRLLLGESVLAENVTEGSREHSKLSVPFPGAAPERQSLLPIQIFAGTYAGSMAGRAVSFVVSVTDRGLLGVKIVGLGDQPTMEFAEIEPQRFFRRDTKTVISFVGATERGFRSLYFDQEGIRENAENTALLAPAKE